MGKNYRKDRLGEEIRKIIGNMLINGLKDPRLAGFVSISAVNVTSDMSYATVYVTVLASGGEEAFNVQKEEVLTAFYKAKGTIRKEIADKIRLRHTPELIFKIDESMEYGRKMSELIDKAVSSDRRNNTLQELADAIREAENILFFPHVNMDGDTLGSSVAICLALRKMGKNAYILIDEDVPTFLDFLSLECCTEDFNKIEKPDLSICVDCGDSERFKSRSEKFFAAKITACIDHHMSSEPFAKLNYIDAKAAATAEIAYDLIEELEADIDESIAEAIFTGITTDTGNFQYSNTTARTHEIVMELYDSGADFNKVSINLYQRNRVEKLKLQADMLSKMEIFADGKAAICFVTKEMLEEHNAIMEDTEGVIDMLRAINGIELAGFVKELEENLCKISLRSKEYINVSEISVKFGGGGHERAAGFSLHMTVKEAVAEIKKLIDETVAS